MVTLTRECDVTSPFRLTVSAAPSKGKVTVICRRDIPVNFAKKELCKVRISRMTSISLVADLEPIDGSKRALSVRGQLVKPPTYSYAPQIRISELNRHITASTQRYRFGRGATYAATVSLHIFDGDDDTYLFTGSPEGGPGPLTLHVIAIADDGSETVVKREKVLNAMNTGIELAHHHFTKGLLRSESRSGELNPGVNRVKFRVYDAYDGELYTDSDIVEILVPSEILTVSN